MKRASPLSERKTAISRRFTPLNGTARVKALRELTLLSFNIPLSLSLSLSLSLPLSPRVKAMLRRGFLHEGYIFRTDPLPQGSY